MVDKRLVASIVIGLSIFILLYAGVFMVINLGNVDDMADLRRTNQKAVIVAPDGGLGHRQRTG